MIIPNIFLSLILKAHRQIFKKSLGKTLTELFGKTDKWRQYINKRVRFVIHRMCLKHVERKKLLARNNKYISLKIC